MEWVKIKRDVKKKNQSFAGYFTLEAALVMPVVLACYFIVMVFLCYTYERSILEQNACRLPVWLEYVDGYMGLYAGEAKDFSKEETCRYVLGRLNEAEKQQYLWGTDILAELTVRGNSIKVDRAFSYTPFGGANQEFTLSAFCLNPVDYIRSTNRIKDTIVEREGESND